MIYGIIDSRWSAGADRARICASSMSILIDIARKGLME